MASLSSGIRVMLVHITHKQVRVDCLLARLQPGSVDYQMSVAKERTGHAGHDNVCVQSVYGREKNEARVGGSAMVHGSTHGECRRVHGTAQCNIPSAVQRGALQSVE